MEKCYGKLDMRTKFAMKVTDVRTPAKCLTTELSFFAEERISPDQCIVEFWKGKKKPFPILSRIAKFVFPLCATNAESELIFKSATEIWSGNRVSTSAGSKNEGLYC